MMFGKLSGLFDRLRPTRRFESEMDEEMQHHLKPRTEHFIQQGMSPNEAARAARLEFGGQDRYREEARQTRWLWFGEEIVQDIRYGIRSLRKSPGFTLTVILTLALGIGANTAMFSVVNGVMIRPLPFEDSERLVNLFQYGPSYPANAPRPPLEQQVNFYLEQERLQSFEGIVAFRNSSHLLLGVDDPQFIRSGLVSANFCSVLGVRPQVGRCITETDEAERAQVVMLSQALWERQFGGDAAALGTTMTLRGRFQDGQERDLPFTVIGVLPREFEVDLDYEMLLPASLSREFGQPTRGASMELARLREGVTPEQAHAEMLGLQRSLRPNQYEGNGGYTMLVFPMMQNVLARFSTQLIILLGVVSLLLLIACANVANLLLSRGAGRMRELSMRAAVGAGRARIVRQLLTESTLLSVVGGAAGLAVAMAGVRGILAVFGDQLPRVESIGLDWRVLAYTAGVSIGGGLLLGLVPALRLSRIDLSEAMKSAGAGSAGGRKQQRWMNGLLVSQVALCMVATIGAGLLINTMIRLRGIDQGYDPEGMTIVSFDLPQDSARAGELVTDALDRVNAMPGTSAALADYPPRIGASMRTEFRRPGTNDQFGPDSPSGNRREVSSGYFEAMRIPMLRGRDFTPGRRASAEGPRTAIVSASLANLYWPQGDALGQTIVVREQEEERLTEIVGIVGDVVTFATGGPEPMLYLNHMETGRNPGYLVARGNGQVGALMGAVQAAVRSVDPNQTFRRGGSYAALVDDEFQRERELMTLLGWFAGLALVLTVVGVAGQVAYAVGRRRSEIAIRVSCGAKPGDLVRMFCAASLWPVGIGVALGGVAALAVTEYAESLLYEVTPTDPATFVAAAGVLLAGAVIASLLSSIKATRVDPAIVLRQE